MNLRIIFKLFGLSLLVMIASIVLSIIEVFIYSLFVPGHPQAFYDAHAQQSAPWVAAICGAVLMFFIVRKQKSKVRLYGWALPSVYLAVDLIILALIDQNPAERALTYLLAHAAHYAGALAGYLTAGKQIPSEL